MPDAPHTPVSAQLRAALAVLVDGLPPRQAAGAVERLIATYRGSTPTAAPVLRDRADVVAYAAYRMPATFEAVGAALVALADRLPDWSPAGHLDVGGGTGAATWAAAEVWGVDGDRATTVLDWAEPALALGSELAAASAAPVLRAAAWERCRLGGALRIRSDQGAGPGAVDRKAEGRERSGLRRVPTTQRGAVPDPASPARSEGPPRGAADLPAADLVTVSYLLGELTERDRDHVVDAAARAGQAVVCVEPGTPDGYLRIRAARDRLLAAGLTVLAPCPHGGTCPIVPGEDWCHFAARVSRSSLHRRVKGGSLPYEDEKYSYVAAVAPALAGTAAPAAPRVVRKPQLRKGQVLLDLCTADDGLRRDTVTKRHGPAYKAARDVAWGEDWPYSG